MRWFARVLTAAIGMTFLSQSSSLAGSVDSYGFRAGANLSGVDSAPLDVAQERRTGFSVALYLEWRLLPYLALRNEVGYTSRGFTEALTERDVFGTATNRIEASTRLDYITLPVILRLHHPGAKVAPYVSGGAAVDILMDRSLGVFEFSDTSFTSTFGDDFDAVEFGFLFGAGAVLWSSITIDARYGFNVTDSMSASSLWEMKMDYFEFAAAYRIR